MKVVFALLLLLGVARADDAHTEAATRFERGVKFFDAGDHKAALAEFEAAYKAVPRFEVLFNIGVTQKRLFKYGASVRSLERYLAEGKEKVPADRRAQVERELAEIHSLVAEVTVRVQGGPADVTVDGEPAGENPLLLAPGRHVLRASREGADPAEQAIEVISATKVDVELAPRPRPRTAKVTITSRPSGADVTVDGKLLGKTPWTTTLDPGGHHVVAELAGHRRRESELVLVAGQDRALELRLDAIPRSRAWYSHWYVWAGVGVALAAGGVTTYVVTRPEPDVQIHF